METTTTPAPRTRTALYVRLPETAIAALERLGVRTGEDATALARRLILEAIPRERRRTRGEPLEA